MRNKKVYGNPIAPSLYSILLGLHYPVKIERSCHRAGTSGKFTVYTVQCTVLLCQYIKQSPVIPCHAGTSADCTVQSTTLQTHQAAYSIQCYRSATPAVYSIQCYLAGISGSVQFHHASMLDNVHCDHADRSGNVLCHCMQVHKAVYSATITVHQIVYSAIILVHQAVYTWIHGLTYQRSSTGCRDTRIIKSEN